MNAPTTADLRAYLRGQLNAERYTEVDCWLDQHPEMAEKLLEEAGADDTGALASVKPTTNDDGFITDGGAGRLRTDSELGTGGMAVVAAARDRALDRVVALKSLKPRQPGESLEQYHLREAAFRREAALTAALEHPAIVPVYDVGRSDGKPAFTMKRLEGDTLLTVVQGGKRSRVALVEALLRVAEAVAFAHSRGVVHRDLTPTNVLLGDFGAVYVLDWGVAAQRGEGGGVTVGTRDWMAPEQNSGAPADARMDVFALGGLLMFILTGHGPRRAGVVDLSPLAQREVPRGLAALARRCLSEAPASRDADAGVVAAELRRWLDEGLTLAQQAGPLTLAWMRLRRSRRARAILLVAVMLVASIVGGRWVVERESLNAARKRVAQIVATVPLHDPEVVAVVLTDARTIAARYPNLTEASELVVRLQAALDLASDRSAVIAQRTRLESLLARTRRSGPWAEEITDWRDVLNGAGMTLTAGKRGQDAVVLGNHPLRLLLVEGLVHLWHAASAMEEPALATLAAQLVAEGGPSAGWRSLGGLMQRTEFQAHQPVFCICAESDGALTDPASAAVLLALYGPDKRLIEFARQQLMRDPGAFWPLIASARAALTAEDLVTAERQALIASGSEPASLFPQLILAYVALARGENAALLAAADRGLAANAAHSELLVLKAVALARDGKLAEAQAMVAKLDAGHLQYHLTHRVGHPMERGVDALVAAGIAIPKADPKLGPLVPGHEHHH
ncbi:MAG TPA: protein kinase [Planctomycetota bacterium]|nr:protein kinase [Planctomycetota bacterium]